MRKYILALVCLLSLNFSSVFAQGFDGKGNVMWNFGVGLFANRGGYFDYLGSKVEFPAFVTSLEFGIHDYVSIGPYFAWQHRSFRGTNRIDNLYYSEWTVRENWFNFGAKAAFHFTPFLNDKARTHIPEELDLYAGIWAGMSVYDKGRYDERAGRSYPVRANAGPSAGILVAGARYFFSDRFGAFVEFTPITDDIHWVQTGFALSF
jgi:hypothetical protein